MKSGDRVDNRLIGPGDNDYGRKPDKPGYRNGKKIIYDCATPEDIKRYNQLERQRYEQETQVPIKELTPELADKIWKSIERKQYDDRVSKERVLHHLKQLKAQMGKYKKEIITGNEYGAMSIQVIINCMKMIDKKIEKL